MVINTGELVSINLLVILCYITQCLLFMSRVHVLHEYSAISRLLRRTSWDNNNRETEHKPHMNIQNDHIKDE